MLDGVSMEYNDFIFKFFMSLVKYRGISSYIIGILVIL